MNPELSMPLSWLLALPAQLRTAILNCHLTLDDASPRPPALQKTAAPSFTPPSKAEMPGIKPASPAQRVARLAAACRISEECILRHIRRCGHAECASLPAAPREVLEEIVRAWADVLAEIITAERSRPMDRSPGRNTTPAIPEAAHASCP